MQPTNLAYSPDAPLDAALFRRFCEIAYNKAGISIKEGKESLVSARVSRRLKALGISTPREYLAYLESDRTGEELVSFLDAITTNFTSFFREPDHFTELSSHILTLCEAGSRKLRIWCAASSTGEEPYTIAMTMAEALVDRNIDWRVLATDLSTQVLERATQGVYPEETVGKIPKPLIHKYFSPVSNTRGETVYQVKETLRSRIVFRRLNLIETPYPMSGPLDAILCRNVMIYFDLPVRQALVTQMERLLAPHGMLFIGHAESLAAIKTGLRVVRPSVYRK